MSVMAEPLSLARSPIRRYGVAVASVTLALLLSIWVPTPLLEKHHSALFFVAVIVSTLYGGMGPGLVAIALAAAGIEYFLVRPFQGVQQLLTPGDGQPSFPEAAWVASVVRIAVFAVSALLISVLNWRRLRAEVAARSSDLELRVARQVQQKLFPAGVPSVPGFDIFGIALPAGAASGDYFDYFPLPGDRLGIVVADVSGHGLGPALLMAATRASLRALALTPRDLSETLALANGILCQDTGDGRFVALLFASLDPRTRSFVYAAAGQAGYLLDASGAVTRLDTTSPPLGIDPGLAFPCAPPRVLEPGQAVLVFTDGVHEAQSPDGSFFGIERALAVARATQGQTAAARARALCQAVRDFARSRPQSDDITVVVIQARPDDRHAPEPKEHADEQDISPATADRTTSAAGPSPRANSRG
jgi:serine phosphatase RsbU (regulator of sigma subunit)